MTNQTQNKRDSFIFYRSFFEATKWLKIDEKALLFEAICNYALDGKIVNLDGTAKGMFELVKPQLDANRKRFENGCVKKQKGSKKEAKKKQTKSKTEANVNVNVNVNEECKLKLELKSQLQLPNFIDKNLFDSFVQMRNKIKKPLTDYAKELLLKDLTKFENIKTGNANIALENSIKNSWQGVFEPKNNNNNNYSPIPQTNSISSSFDEKKNFYLENRNRIHPNLNEINDILNKIDNNQSKTQIIAYKAKTAFFVSNNANANLDLDEKLEKYFDLIVVLDYKTKEKYEL